MDADYSVELGPTAAALEFPWKDPEERVRFFDLRSNPSLIGQIPEAQQFPALSAFLVHLNSQSIDWQTAKCDVWAEEIVAAENLYNAGFAQSSYVDIVLAGSAIEMRTSLETHQRLAQEIAGLLEANEELEATAEIVVRRCYFHGGDGDAYSWDESNAGFCLTLFVTGFGESGSEAKECWARTMEFAARCWLTLHSSDAKVNSARERL